MRRPTIADLARAAGVSVATVNRVLAGAPNVRLATRERVSDAAARIGFYGTNALRSRVAAARPRHRFGFLLQQPHRAFYRTLAQALQEAAAAVAEAEIEARLEFLADLAPQNVAARLEALGRDCAAVAVVAAVHPTIITAVDELRGRGVPVLALVSELTAADAIAYVGLDNWKAGRVSAWAAALACRRPGKLGVLVGHHRYRCHELREAGFRSYLREHAPGFTPLEPQATFEQSAVAQEHTEALLAAHPDLVGLYVAGGGITGALAAVRAQGRAGELVVIGHDLLDVTRAALLDGTMTLLTSHPFARMAEVAVATMLRAVSDDARATASTILPLEIWTRECL